MGFVVVIVAILGPFTYGCYQFRQKAIAEMPEGYEFPMMSDFWFAVKVAAVFSLIEAAVRFHLFKYFMPFCKEQDDTLMREIRSIKAAVHIWKGINLLSTSLFCFVMFKDTHFLHYLFGGKAKDYSLTFSGYPYTDRSEYPQLKVYYLVSMAYHMSTIVPMFYSASRKDLVEMILHHTIVMFLYFGGYLMNIWESASTFVFINDVGDVPLVFLKVLAESNFKIASGVGMVFMMVVWAYFRMFAQGWIIYETATLTAPLVKWEPFMLNTFVGLMSTLCMMNHYWFYLFIGILKRFILLGIREDTVGGVEKKEKGIQQVGCFVQTQADPVSKKFN